MRPVLVAALLLGLGVAHGAPKAVKGAASASSSSEVIPPVSDEKPKLISSDTYACMPAANPQGFNWDGRRWQPVGFKAEEPFTLNVALVQSGYQMYLHFQRKSASGDVHCGTAYNIFADSTLSCSSVGETTVFASKTASGAITRALGATDDGGSRDSLTIMPFTCQKFIQ